MPFSSEAQRRLFYAVKEGKAKNSGISKATADKFINHDTGGSLPEHAKKSPKDLLKCSLKKGYEGLQNMGALSKDYDIKKEGDTLTYTKTHPDTTNAPTINYKQMSTVPKIPVWKQRQLAEHPEMPVHAPEPTAKPKQWSWRHVINTKLEKAANLRAVPSVKTLSLPKPTGWHVLVSDQPGYHEVMDVRDSKKPASHPMGGNIYRIRNPKTGITRDVHQSKIMDMVPSKEIA